MTLLTAQQQQDIDYNLLKNKPHIATLNAYKNDSLVAGGTISKGNAVYIKDSDNKLYKTDASGTESAYKFVGFARKDASTGDAVELDTEITATQSGLDAGQEYFLTDTAGTISTSPGTYKVKVGVAINSTTLLMGRQWQIYTGVQTLSATGNTTITCNFAPIIVVIHAIGSSALFDTNIMSFGSTHGARHRCTHASYTTATAMGTRTDYTWYLQESASDYHRGTVTLLSSGFTLVNTKNNSPGNAYLHYMAFG